MTYPQVQAGEDATESEYVKFDAFFLRDLDGDGYAESLRGSCRKIGESDTLYMELKVLTNGHLEDGVISINGNNFYLKSALPKDNIIKDNVIGDNIKKINLNSISSGTQKLFTGEVCSGNYAYSSQKSNAIKGNITNYSKKNTITLTGTHVANDGTKTNIKKEIELQMDWHGKVTTKIEESNTSYQYTDENFNKESGELSVNIGIRTKAEGNLIIKKSVLSGNIPQLNGYNPIRVENNNDNTTFEYDAETRNFKIFRETKVDEETGKVINEIGNDNTYSLNIVYPIEAYNTLGTTSFTLRIPVSSYHEAYNNSNKEFNNPEISNTAQAVIVRHFYKKTGRISFNVTVGKLTYKKDLGTEYMVSKQKPLKIYNGIPEKEDDDKYEVMWQVELIKETSGLILKEPKNTADQFITEDNRNISMEEITSNIGIYFSDKSYSYSDPSQMLGEDGWIKIYDNETDELLGTFTKENWNQYTKTNPYKYEIPVAHIRVETSKTNENSNLHIYNIKSLDDDYITKKFTREEFDNLQYIQSTMETFFEGESVNIISRKAYYVAPATTTSLSISKRQLSTQKKEDNIYISINAKANTSQNEEEWKNGSFLVKLPKEILDIEINQVRTSDTNVKILSYEKINENGITYIKINTENEEPTSFYIYVNCNISSDPRSVSVSKEVELYAYNENATDYSNKVKDIYDINDNLNKEENVTYESTTINFVSPESLLTTQQITNYNEEESAVIAPQVGKISKEQQTADINISITNNYTNTISEVLILGRVPFTGNKYVINGKTMDSVFTTSMTDSGINLPEVLQGKAKIYYSEKEEATKDLQDSGNAWTSTPEDFKKVKSYLIDLQNYSLAVGETHTFTYTIEISDNKEYNDSSYGHHAVYFSLDTEEGKYKTQVEPNKVGLRVTKEYDLEIIKYQKGKNKLVPGATYSITEENGDTRTKVTGENGHLEIDELYVGKTYIVKEIKTPEGYELNPEEVKFKITEENKQLKVNIISGTVRKLDIVKSEENIKEKIILEVEDEIKSSLKITKTIQGANEKIPFVKFKITGKNFEKGKILRTNTEGEITIKGLTLGEEYTLEETQVEEYYPISPIKFRIDNIDGTYKINITEGTVKKALIEEIDSMPIANLTIENEKVPTYDLKINKIVKDKETPLSGAKFRLIKENKKIGEYTTDENGVINISNLYAYEEERNINQTYMLKEVAAPDGFATIKDIIFKVEKSKDGTLNIDIQEGKIKESTVESNTVNMIIEDSPSFKLIKKDGETGDVLPNTKFAIYSIDEGIEQIALDSKSNILGTKEIIDGKEYYTLTTNENGEITANLKEGLYKAVEVKASDEKYEITNNIYYFGIGASRKGIEKLEGQWGTSIANGELQEILNEISGENNKIMSHINDIVTTDDGGYVAVGTIYSYDSTRNVTIGNKTFEVGTNNYGMIIKFNSNNEVENAEVIGSKYSGQETELKAVEKTDDGGYIVGGYTCESDEIIEIDPDDVIPSEPSDPFAPELPDIGIPPLEFGKFTIEPGAIVIKFDVNGEAEWGDSLGYNPLIIINERGVETLITNITRVKDGGYIVGGNFHDSIDIGDYKLKDNNIGILMVKYTLEGEIEWAKSIGGELDDTLTGITATDDGGYIISGNFTSNSIDAGTDTLINNGKTDGVIVKYTQTGEVEWAKSIGGSDEDEITGIIATKDGGYVIAGNFKSASVDLGTYTLTNNGKTDGMIVKYTQAGNIEWATTIGGSDEDTIEAIKETDNSGIIISGILKSTRTKIGEELLRAGSILVEYDKDGKVETTSLIDETAKTSMKIIERTRNDEYLVGVNYSKNIYNNSNPGVGGGDAPDDPARPPDGTNNIRTAALLVGFSKKELGNPQIVKASTIGGNKNEDITSVIETADGGQIVAGNFSSSNIKIGEHPLINNSSYENYSDGIIVKYDIEGKEEWIRQIEGTNNEKINKIVPTNDGGCIINVFFTSSSITIGEYTLKNTSSYVDSIIAKISKTGEVEWIEQIAGNYNDLINSIVLTNDGGFIIVGESSSENIKIGDKIITTNNHVPYYTFGMIIKYNNERKVEWSHIIGDDSNYNKQINTITTTKDGGYIAGGNFSSSTIKIGEYTLNNSSPTNCSEGMVIKYNSKGGVEWVFSIGKHSNDVIYSIVETEDDGFVIGRICDNTYDNYNVNETAYMTKYNSKKEIEWEKTFLGNKISIIGTKDYSYMAYIGNKGNIRLVQYNNKGKIEWEKEIEGDTTNTRQVNSLFENSDKSILIGGNFKNTNIEIDGNILTNEGSTDGMMLKIVNYSGVAEVSEITAENRRKEFKISTDIEKIDGVKGGNITGEKMPEYEVVKYGDNSVKPIVMQPEENYEIIKITVNDEEWLFTANPDGTYTMPQFENVTENKHIVVTYSLKSNKFVINKIDSKTKEPIQGAEFKLDQIEERTVPNDVIGPLTGNSQIYTEPDTTSEVTGVQGTLTSNGTYYFVKKADGTYIPTNSKNYTGSTGVKNTTANSYIPINLTGKTGKYHIIINAKSSSGYSDYGYATVTQSTTAPAYYSSTGRFVYLYGTSSSTTTAKDYTSMVLEGGKTYYLHLGYRKSSSSDTGEDQITINSIKVYKSKDVQYNFVNKNGEYVSTNQGKNDTVSASYVPIDLTNVTGKYNLIVTAKISSYAIDYGYATVTQSTTAPKYNDLEGRIVYISGTSSSVTTAKEYTTVLQGGEKYYLHLGYRKGTSTAGGTDTFTVSDIKITLNDGDLWHTKTETNSQGQAIIQIPFGKYNLTEINTPEGYQPLEKTAVIEFKSSNKSILENENKTNISMNANGEVVVENIPKVKITTHHYLKDRNGNYTTTKLAEDEIIYGNINENYTTLPHLNLEKYDLEKDISGNYIIPEKAAGTFGNKDLELFYYYEERKVPITVHHYIEGTMTQVPLADGVIPEDLTEDGFSYEEDGYKSSGYEGENYITNAIKDEKLSDEYELSKIPENAEGQYSGEEIIVNYYYKKVKRNVNLVKYAEDGETPLAGAKFTITKVEENKEEDTIYTTNEKGKINVVLEAGEYEITEIEAPQGYKIPENPKINVVITKATTEEKLEITNEKIKGTVIVHHYIKGTTTPILIVNPETGETIEAQDEIKTGYLGEIYTTKVKDNIASGYEYESVEGQTSGEYAEGTIEVTYYYKAIVEIEIVKKWDHTNNNYEIPESMTIELYADGEKIQETTMTRENRVTVEGELPTEETWRYTFERLPKYKDDGTEIEYTISEKK